MSLTANDSLLRLLIFLCVLVLMGSLEYVIPRKARQAHRPSRWFTNMALSVLGALSIRFLLPIVAVGAAVFAEQQAWGLFNVVRVPLWAELFGAILILDLLIYWQHVASHFVPLLWRFHKVHHADIDVDVTTAVRFHPGEIMLSMMYKIVCILLLGPELVAVIAFEILLNASALFNHSNIAITPRLDRYLRWLIVTPDMHRVHHSTVVPETNSNFGFSLSIWDRVFASYVAQPRKDHENMTTGLAEYQQVDTAGLLWCLSLPFRRADTRGDVKSDDT